MKSRLKDADRLGFLYFLIFYQTFFIFTLPLFIYL